MLGDLLLFMVVFLILNGGIVYVYFSYWVDILIIVYKNICNGSKLLKVFIYIIWYEFFRFNLLV